MKKGKRRIMEKGKRKVWQLSNIYATLTGLDHDWNVSTTTTLISEFSGKSDESGCFVSCVDQWMAECGGEEEGVVV